MRTIVIERVIGKNGSNGTPSKDQINKEILKITNTLKDQTVDNFAQEFHNQNRKKGIAAANKKARKIVDESWETISGRLQIVSGKKTISQLSSWATEKYGVSFGANTLLYEIQAHELTEEVRYVIESIENISTLNT